MSDVDIIIDAPACALSVFNTPPVRICVTCIAPIQEFPWGFECECGCCFSLAVVGPAFVTGRTVILVEPLLPEEPDEDFGSE